MQTENLTNLTLNYLTETEYNQAKTNGELEENQLYMTPDDSSTSESNSSNEVDIITGNETKAGYKVNGKDVYVKRVHFTKNGTAWTTIATLTNAAELIGIKGYFAGGDYQYVLPYLEGADYITFTLSSSTKELMIKSSSAFSGFSGIINVEYTKTTD